MWPRSYQSAAFSLVFDSLLERESEAKRNRVSSITVHSLPTIYISELHVHISFLKYWLLPYPSSQFFDFVFALSRPKIALLLVSTFSFNWNTFFGSIKKYAYLLPQMSLSVDAIYNLINSNPLPIPVHLLKERKTTLPYMPWSQKPWIHPLSQRQRYRCQSHKRWLFPGQAVFWGFHRACPCFIYMKRVQLKQIKDLHAFILH